MVLVLLLLHDAAMQRAGQRGRGQQMLLAVADIVAAGAGAAAGAQQCVRLVQRHHLERSPPVGGRLLAMLRGGAVGWSAFGHQDVGLDWIGLMAVVVGFFAVRGAVWVIIYCVGCGADDDDDDDGTAIKSLRCTRPRMTTPVTMTAWMGDDGADPIILFAQALGGGGGGGVVGVSMCDLRASGGRQVVCVG